MRLGPDLGPGVRHLHDDYRACLLPGPDSVLVATPDLFAKGVPTVESRGLRCDPDRGRQMLDVYPMKCLEERTCVPQSSTGPCAFTPWGSPTYDVGCDSTVVTTPGGKKVVLWENLEPAPI